MTKHTPKDSRMTIVVKIQRAFNLIPVDKPKRFQIILVREDGTWSDNEERATKSAAIKLAKKLQAQSDKYTFKVLDMRNVDWVSF